MYRKEIDTYTQKATKETWQLTFQVLPASGNKLVSADLFPAVHHSGCTSCQSQLQYQAHSDFKEINVHWKCSVWGRTWLQIGRLWSWKNKWGYWGIYVKGEQTQLDGQPHLILNQVPTNHNLRQPPPTMKYIKHLLYEQKGTELWMSNNSYLDKKELEL